MIDAATICRDGLFVGQHNMSISSLPLSLYQNKDHVVFFIRVGTVYLVSMKQKCMANNVLLEADYLQF
ncbi:hypothetical protein A0J61_10295 [Choanephora cucurbitarum]|uniref:Uncharacterized protein n=1 Tax=Choanephora cucurbitarum TaxID=101091 RepID=A0A1C7MXT1_9FUNG|nr:hypothetical protein A0J61_10295 [Choanephora cucurbitarum]